MSAIWKAPAQQTFERIQKNSSEARVYLNLAMNSFEIPLVFASFSGC